MVRVVKVGGSLLRYRRLPQALRGWLDRQPPAANLLLAGGGPLADFIREANATFQIGEQPSHWLCIAAMGVSARLLLSFFPQATFVSLLLSLPTENGVWILDAEKFLREQEPFLPGEPLPHGWHVTSDSIAARVANVASATELVLLKSCLPSAGASFRQAASENYVDAWFPQAVASIPAVRAVNLRDESFPEVLLHG